VDIFSYMCKKNFLLFTTVKTILKIDRDFSKLCSNALPPFFMVHSVYLFIFNQAKCPIRASDHLGLVIDIKD